MDEDQEASVVEVGSATPHFDKLRELLSNSKLPELDAKSIQQAIERYKTWIGAMDGLKVKGEAKIKALVEELNEYKRFVELEVIWDSEADFLYRQRGQLKLDNSILEEFLPRLVDPDIFPSIKGRKFEVGPRTTFSSVYFTTTLMNPVKGAGLEVRRKDQDFTVSLPVHLAASLDDKFPAAQTASHKIFLAFVATECKTNLDKTMFQEAVATAHDLKVAVPGARYFLISEWLDMTPISTRGTDIEEVMILRGQRLQSNVRGKFAKSTSRKAQRKWYEDFLSANPIREDLIMRFVEHLRGVFDAVEPNEKDVLMRGYF